VVSLGGQAESVGQAESLGSQPLILVSACLLGVACNHRGLASPSSAVAAMATHSRLIPVCPEVAGGLPTPRPAAEMQPDGRVCTADGTDITESFRRGAAQALALAQATSATRTVLKARSPSCGCHGVYDGRFSRTLGDPNGEGVTAAALRGAGVEVISDEDVADR
jgi:uncharacterized protein YbbK (DUF523 family)